ncbi:MAG: C-terminal helicase domain-containing protein [Bdellovibrionales bacterium]|nr:C-terminal helicase domain-containing protein [Bdellovibrionales bacterium]
MLETQNRMNAGIQEWSSNRFYNGRLKPDDSNRDRDVLSGVSSASGLLGTSPVNLIRHGGSSQNNANLTEAAMVADLVQALSDDGYLPFAEIGIVTPHRAQAGAICGALQAKIGIGDAQRILVDTVERFQGQEREAMIFSIGVEHEQHTPGEKEFLSDGRRLNVAVTRARSRFYCFAPEKLMTNSLFLPKENHLKSLLGWCDSSKGNHAKKTKSIA